MTKSEETPSLPDRGTPRPVGRPRKITPDVQRALCEHVECHGWNPGAVAVRADCSLSTLYHAIQGDAEFRDAIEAAKGVFLATLEAEAYRRAVEGVETVKSLDKQGNPIVVRVYSDALLAKLLVANGPEKHGQRIHVDKRVSGQVAHQHSAAIDVARLPAEDKAALRGVLQRRRLMGVRGTEAQDVPQEGAVQAHDENGADVPITREHDEDVSQ